MLDYTLFLFACFLSFQLDQVLIDDVLPVMKEDSLTTSHPIVVNVSSPAEITSVFDGISYSKVGNASQHILDYKERWVL